MGYAKGLRRLGKQTWSRFKKGGHHQERAERTRKKGGGGGLRGKSNSAAPQQITVAEKGEKIE